MDKERNRKYVFLSTSYPVRKRFLAFVVKTLAKFLQHNTTTQRTLMFFNSFFLPGKSTIENELCFPSRSDNKNICKLTFKNMAERS